jgi:tetratricopeptide (TPR) repeat protein
MGGGSIMSMVGPSRRTLVVLAVVALSVGACGNDIDPDQTLQEGLAQQQAGDLLGAAEKYQLVLEARPEDQYANYNMGVIEQAGGRTALAEGYYRASLSTAPDFVPAMFNLAILRTQLGATQEAIELYERVLTVQPDYAAAHLNLGLLFRDSNQPIPAQKHLNKAVKLDPALADRLPIESQPTPSPQGSGPPEAEETSSATESDAP